jgi:hypothetical protein
MPFRVFSAVRPRALLPKHQCVRSFSSWTADYLLEQAGVAVLQRFRRWGEGYLRMFCQLNDQDPAGGSTNRRRAAALASGTRKRITRPSLLLRCFRQRSFADLNLEKELCVNSLTSFADARLSPDAHS